MPLKKTLKLLYISPMLLVLGCSTTPSPEKNTQSEKSETTKETSAIGKVLIGALVFLGTKGDVAKALKATKFGGNAVGYFAGEKLTTMQKSYKEKEETLIGQILTINEASERLKEQNSQLSENLLLMDEEITQLEKDKTLKTTEQKELKANLNSKLTAQKERLTLLRSDNEKLKEQILNSKKKSKAYNYKSEDKEEILKSIEFLNTQSKEQETSINENLRSINTLLAKL